MKYDAIAVYIMANKRNGTLYVGVTSDLIKRGHEHRQKLVQGFTQKYGLRMLVYYELHQEMTQAIHREKRLKKYTRKAKLTLIERFNPRWDDLYETLL